MQSAESAEIHVIIEKDAGLLTNYINEHSDVKLECQQRPNEIVITGTDKSQKKKIRLSPWGIVYLCNHTISAQGRRKERKVVMIC